MGKHTPSGGSLKDYRSLLLKIVERKRGLIIYYV
ncbi:hypothetical protein LCGC14_1704950 [marine sediment metagenome]|uniref:Uncharacterized protein n=1 Tax=marine sediment metagenome TaxID=412755 RepID=A0A0F9I4H7_9ZZZZ